MKILLPFAVSAGLNMPLTLICLPSPYCFLAKRQQVQLLFRSQRRNLFRMVLEHRVNSPASFHLQVGPEIGFALTRVALLLDLGSCHLANGCSGIDGSEPFFA